ncbi:MAG: hypothetical protein HRT66_06880 [Flavobacteriaceae bacterium]|nr:hypothetical protein [Flavobacteriaceae bacterium]
MKKLINPIFVLLISFAFLSMEAHKFHVSLTQLYYNEDANQIEITLRIFADDMQEAIKHNDNIDLYLTSGQRHKDSDKYIKDYLLNNLKIKVNDGIAKISYIGMEDDPDDIESILCYLKIKNIPEIKQFSISNNVLMGLYNDQVNMVKVRFYDIFKSFIQKELNTNSTLKF